MSDNTKYLQTKQEWIDFCKKHNVKSCSDYNALCDKYECLPKNPGDFYSDFTNLRNELDIKSKIR
jgi:hypothetical protein